jgi:hypothetical protein
MLSRFFQISNFTLLLQQNRSFKRGKRNISKNIHCLSTLEETNVSLPTLLSNKNKEKRNFGVQRTNNLSNIKRIKIEKLSNCVKSGLKQETQKVLVKKYI